MLEVAEFGTLAEEGNEDKLVAKIALLEGCAAVYCQAVGASSIRQLMAKGIQPVKVHEGSPVARLIQDLQDELKDGPSTWVAKAVARQKGSDSGRFDRMEAEGWDE
jgi:nitrogen fixation protein NifX